MGTGRMVEETGGLQGLQMMITNPIIFLSREGRDLGVAFQAPPGSQASSRGEAKDSALLAGWHH